MKPIITTITSNWQIYLPEEVRKAMKLTKLSRLKISVVKNKAIVEPAKGSILDAAGMFSGAKPVKKIDVDNIRDHIDYSR